jgi:hypothetical protein
MVGGKDKTRMLSRKDVLENCFYLSAPHCLAGASLLGEVEIAVTVFPIALAIIRPICPRPPRPAIPTFRPPRLA